jgi:hypothetical protein
MSTREFSPPRKLMAFRKQLEVRLERQKRIKELLIPKKKFFSLKF